MYVAAPSWHSLMGQKYAMEVQVKAREYYGKSITMCFFFETDSQETGFNSFLYGLGIGSGQIREMESGETRSVSGQDPPDLQGMIGKQKEFLVYDGHSLVDDCEPTKYVFMLASVYINYKQALELQRNVDENRVVPISYKNRVYQNFDKTSPRRKKNPPHPKNNIPLAPPHRIIPRRPKPPHYIPPPQAYTPPPKHYPHPNLPPPISLPHSLRRPPLPVNIPAAPYVPNASPKNPVHVHIPEPIKKAPGKVTPKAIGVPLPPPVNKPASKRQPPPGKRRGRKPKAKLSVPRGRKKPHHKPHHRAKKIPRVPVPK